MFRITTKLARFSPRCKQTYQQNLQNSYKTVAPVFGYNPAQEQQLKTDYLQEPKTADDIRVGNLISAYRLHGHKIARINPLESESPLVPADSIFDIARYNLSEHENTGSILLSNQNENLTTSDLINRLHAYYCRDITVETSHVLNLKERNDFHNLYEESISQQLTNEDKLKSALLMIQSQALDVFLATRFGTTKRYGGEGAEACLPFYYELFKMSADSDIENIVMCTAHRGRLNLLNLLLDLPAAAIFQKIRGMSEWPPGVNGSGDVLSHLTGRATIMSGNNQVYITMIPNPSHLEAANPVAVGKTRAKQRFSNDGSYHTSADRKPGDRVMCFQVHGDAAFAGQGIVPETLALSEVPHYTVGGSVHLIINNQLGFTTGAARGRSSEYPSCIAKMNSIPIIRVNGENPEAVLKSARVAFQYRQEYKKDIVVDLVCYRRWGHNELDDPSFTQPQMYENISNRTTLPDLYSQSLVNEGITTQAYFDDELKTFTDHLKSQYDSIGTYEPKAHHLERLWSGLVQPGDNTTVWDTGVNTELLSYITSKSVNTPAEFVVHPTLAKTHVLRRKQKAESGTGLDWATAEACAFGSLLSQGFDVRLSGQDVGRGTFSHRHVMLVDQETDAIHIPLNHLTEQSQGYLEVCNSILSEEAVLGFEYGYSIESPKSLTVWEAQFGDFFNGAQIIIDTFIASGETKWLLQSGLVMLLPTGMDGAGPEHSSCRIERFLNLTDSSESQPDTDQVNMSVCNPTTPAQYFHLLRRQVVRNFRKPLIMAAPKTLLRHPSCVSDLNEMKSGTSFQPVLSDHVASRASTLIFCSGKHYYTLLEERERRGHDNQVAIIRIEEICPFPLSDLQSIIKTSAAKTFIWSQEEHRNAGMWSFISARFNNMVGVQLKYAGRDVLAAPATGIGSIHKLENVEILNQTFDLATGK